MENKRVIRGVKTIAAVLSAGSMIIPIANLRSNSISIEKEIQSYIHSYSAEFNSDALENGKQMYEHIAKMYSKYKNHTIKTKIGETTINLDDFCSYTVCTINKKDEKKATYTYNLNGSYSLSESDNDKITTVQFDENGLIETLEEKSINGEYSLYKYQDGDMEVYTLYGANNQIQEKKNKDGSYSIYKYDNSCGEPYIDDEFEHLEYNYDEDDNLMSIDAYNEKIYEDGKKMFRSLEDTHSQAELMPHIEDIHTIYQPNGDSYTYIKYFDIDRQPMGDKKVRRKYQDYKWSIESTVVDGKSTTIISKYDYKVPNPELSFHFYPDEIDMGTTVYEKVNGDITVFMRDGVIFKYTSDDIIMNKKGFDMGQSEICSSIHFRGAYKVQEDGVMHYDEYGEKLFLENVAEGKVVYYDENIDEER